MKGSDDRMPYKSNRPGITGYRPGPPPGPPPNPPHPIHRDPVVVTFENTIAVSDTSNTNNNVVYSVDSSFVSTLSASFVNIGSIGFNVNLIFNSGPSRTFTLVAGDSITFLYDDIREIALTGFSPTEPYFGTFKYQVSYIPKV